MLFMYAYYMHISTSCHVFHSTRVNLMISLQSKTWWTSHRLKRLNLWSWI